MEIPLEEQVIQKGGPVLPGRPLAAQHIPAEEVPQWPKPEGWDFQPGYAAFNGKVFAINRKKKELLHRFVRARGMPLTIAQLRTDVWPDYGAGDATIRGYVCDLRKLLRESLNLEFNPLINVDTGAYRLLLR